MRLGVGAIMKITGKSLSEVKRDLEKYNVKKWDGNDPVYDSIGHWKYVLNEYLMSCLMMMKVEGKIDEIRGVEYEFSR